MTAKIRSEATKTATKKIGEVRSDLELCEALLLLSAEEEIELAKRMENGDEAAKKRLAESPSKAAGASVLPGDTE